MIDHQIAMHAPKESQSYKNSVNGVGKMCHRYTFTKIFKPATRQNEIFMEIVQPKVKDFLEGQNQLIFTYGATSAGKTFTIQVMMMIVMMIIPNRAKFKNSMMNSPNR